MRKLKHREVKLLYHGRTASNGKHRIYTGFNVCALERRMKGRDEGRERGNEATDDYRIYTMCQIHPEKCLSVWKPWTEAR